MNQRDNPLFWSFSLGNWLSTDVRVSWFMLLLWAGLIISFGPVYGTAVAGVLFVSVLLHEFGHVFGARLTGGQADEILLWPLGGLAFVQPARSFASQLLTTAAGPLVNFILCAATLSIVLTTDYRATAWHPFVIPIPLKEFDVTSGYHWAVLTFSLNWMSLVLNLIPAHPLDGGQMLRAFLTSRLGTLQGAEWSTKIGIVAGICLAVVGVVVKDVTWLIGLGVFLVILAMHELQRIQYSEMTEESEFGYDFSQGYTSLERSLPATQEPKPGLWKRWKQQREEERRRREALQEQEDEAQLDAILAKLHEQGMTALSPSEKRILERASAKYRKGRPDA